MGQSKKDFSQELSLQVYCENGVYGAYLSDYDGGSGIDVKGTSADEVIRELMPYIKDYLYY